MKHSLLGMAMVASMLIATPFAHATIITYTANLSGANEPVPNGSFGTGSALVTIDDILNTMIVDVTFSGLTGTTTAAHIHCCTAVPLTSTAAVATTLPSFTLFPLGVTSGSYNDTLDLLSTSSYSPAFVTANVDLAGAEAFLLNGMSLDEAYLNIHTSAFPGGEIRGFLTAAHVPEPGTLPVLITGLVLLGFTAHRKGKQNTSPTLRMA
jgi:CHRD domain/PEP-CTERM motif